MNLLKTRCPECNAGLKSPTGFTVGQTVCCPKCETYFAVEEPEEKEEAEEPEAPKKAAKKVVKAVRDDDEDEVAPKKKKKKKKRDGDEDEEETRSYKNSPLRFVVLGVLVTIMLVLGYFLYEKKKKERADETASSGANASDTESAPKPRQRPPIDGPIGMPPAKGPNAPGGGKLPNMAPPKQGALNLPLGLGGPAANQAQIDKVIFEKFKTALVGRWTADLGDGVTQELTYDKNGTFSAKLTGPTPAGASGKYTVTQLVGTKGLKIRHDTAEGPRLIVAIFEDDELQHPSLQPGVTGTFRKKK